MLKIFIADKAKESVKSNIKRFCSEKGIKVPNRIDEMNLEELQILETIYYKIERGAR